MAASTASRNAALPFAAGVNCAPQLAAISSDALRYMTHESRTPITGPCTGLVQIREFIDRWKLIVEGRYSDEREVKVTGPDRPRSRRYRPTVSFHGRWTHAVLRSRRVRSSCRPVSGVWHPV